MQRALQGALVAGASLLLCSLLLITSGARHETVELLPKQTAGAGLGPFKPFVVGERKFALQNLLKDANHIEDAAEKAYTTNGAIPASVAKQWRKKFEKEGGTSVPEGSFFDSTNSEVWQARNKRHTKDMAWLDPQEWIYQRRAGGKDMNLGKDFVEPEFADGRWWPYNPGNGVKTPDDEFMERLYHSNHKAKSLEESIRDRYNTVKKDPYMDYQYKRFVQGPDGPEKTAKDAVGMLNYQAQGAVSTVNQIFGDHERGAIGTPAFPPEQREFAV